MFFDALGAVLVQSYVWGYQVEAAWLYSILFILGLAVAIISIVLSSYTCRAICCRRSTAGSVIYNPSGVGATAQTIPLGNLDLSKATASTAPESQELLAPSYNAQAKMMYEPPKVVLTDRVQSAHAVCRPLPESRSLLGTRVF